MRFSRVMAVVVTAGLIALAAEVRADHHAGEDVLPEKADQVRPALVGTEAPDGVLRSQSGEETSLKELAGGKPAVLVFYRGHW